MAGRNTLSANVQLAKYTEENHDLTQSDLVLASILFIFNRIHRIISRKFSIAFWVFPDEEVAVSTPIYLVPMTQGFEVWSRVACRKWGMRTHKMLEGHLLLRF